MLVSFFVLLLAGIPVALTLAISGFVFGYLGFGTLLFNLLPHRIFGVVTNSTLLAIPLFVFMGMMLEKSRLAEDLMDVIGHRRRLAARRARHRHHPGRRADGRDHRHRRRDRGDARPADAARHAAARLRQGPRLRRDLRLRHARPDHPAEPDPDPARRHPERVGRHAVRRRDDPGPDAGGHLLSSTSSCSASCGRTWCRRFPPEERALVSRSRACRQARSRSSRRRSALVGAVLGSIIAGIAAPSEAASMGALGSILVTAIDRPAVLEGAARDLPGDHQDHRDDDVHPDLRAGVRARLPRPAGREARSGPVRVPAGRHQCRHLVPDADHLHPRLLHRVDRDFLHRGAAVPAGVHRRPMSTWCGSRR